MFTSARRARGGNPPLVPAAGPARQSLGPVSCRHLAGAIAWPRPRDRQPRLRSAMETAFCGTDAEGAWVWKDAYEALEAAQVMFLRKFGNAMRTRAGDAGDARDADPACRPSAVADPPLGRIRALPAILDADRARLCRRRSRHPDFGRSRARTLGRHRLAGDLRRTGQSASRANEIADTRAGLLGRLFRGIDVALTTPSRSTTGSIRRSGRAWC